MVRESHKLVRILASILCAGILMSFLPFSAVGEFKSLDKKTFIASVTLRPPQDYVEKNIGPPGGSLYLEDGTGVTIPEGALTKWVSVFIERIKDLQSLPLGNRAAMPVEPISAYEFGASDLEGKKVNSLMFNKASTVILAYGDRDGILEERLRIFWRDLLDWRLSGGEVDKKKKIVTAKNVMHLSKFALFPIRFGLSADAYRPVRKIITPAFKDGINDQVEFENLDGKQFTIRIYDITGKRIKILRNNPVWDGTDDDGDIVESGVYIYQLKVEDKVISGVIAVAK
ncbi:hypothetical protein ES705_46447 [subsurface metagenome]